MRLHKDWIEAMLKDIQRIETKLTVTRLGVDLTIIPNIFSKQLRSLPLNEEKFRSMMKNG